jgi:hypothetical protein
VAEAKLRLVPDPAPSFAAPSPPIAGNPYTSMAPRFGRTATLLARRFLARLDFEPGDAEQQRELDRAGAVIYVMRYSSRLDYFCSTSCSSARRALSGFANGIKFFYLPAVRRSAAPPGAGHRGAHPARRERHARAEHPPDPRARARGRSAFLFCAPTRSARACAETPRAARGPHRADYLREVVDTAFASEVPVSLVPLALFWRKGPRPERPFLNLFYGANERPTDVGKVIGFVWNYSNLAVRVGQAIDLRRFVDENRASGRERIVSRCDARLDLPRREKPVVGAALPSFARREAVLDDGECAA